MSNEHMLFVFYCIYSCDVTFQKANPVSVSPHVRYDRCLEAQRIFNDDLDNMICFLLEDTRFDPHEASAAMDERGKGKDLAWDDEP